MAADEEGSLRVFVTTDDGIKTSNPDWWETHDHLILPWTDTHPKCSKWYSAHSGEGGGGGGTPYIVYIQ